MRRRVWCSRAIRTICLTAAAAMLIVAVGPGFQGSPVRAADHGLVFQIRDSVEVEGEQIKLADLVDMYSEGPLDIELLQSVEEKLSRRELRAAPDPGYERNISPDLPIRELEGLGLEEEFGIDVAVEGTDRIRVQRAARTLAPAEIEGRAEEYILELVDAGGDDVRPEIEISPPQSEILVPVGELEIIPGGERSLSARELSGSTTLPVEIRVDGRRVDSVYLRTRVRLYREVLVARERINHHQELEPELLALEERDMGELRESPLTDREQAEGLRAVRSISPGAIISTDMIEDPPLVRRGDRVQIVARRGRVLIAAQGEAREDGPEGEIIRVLNDSSGETVRAQVVDEGLVEVSF